MRYKNYLSADKTRANLKQNELDTFFHVYKLADRQLEANHYKWCVVLGDESLQVVHSGKQFKRFHWFEVTLFITCFSPGFSYSFVLLPITTAPVDYHYFSCK